MGPVVALAIAVATFGLALYSAVNWAGVLQLTGSDIVVAAYTAAPAATAIAEGAAAQYAGGPLGASPVPVGAAVREGEELATRGRALATWEEWPSHGGFLGGFAQPEVAQPGQILSRVGGLGGRYVSPLGTTLGQRGLPSMYPNTPETLWEVVQPFKMQGGVAARWKNAPGMGVQFRMESTVQELWDAGLIRPWSSR